MVLFCFLSLPTFPILSGLKIKPRWQQRKILTWLTQLQHVQFCINHSRNYRANSMKVIRKKPEYFNAGNFFNIIFNFTSVTASLLFFIESSVFIPISLVSWGEEGPKAAFPEKHTHTWVGVKWVFFTDNTSAERGSSRMKQSTKQELGDKEVRLFSLNPQSQ